ncbi:MAG: DUF6077 domain-containing protein [Lachnospiraceae bacterium]|nr:DUF6077 domain-containing protein [Lachnospiraceae bacterium]
MVQIIGSAVLILFICNLIGQLWVNKWEEYQDSLWMATIMGLLTLFAAFQVVAVPAIFMKVKLHVMVIYMAVVIAALSVASFVYIFKSGGAYYKHQAEKLKKAVKDKGNIWLLVAAALILLHTYYGAFYDKAHGDDVRYVGAVVDAVETDEMLMYHPGTGEYLGELQSEFFKDAVAPILMFWAMWCRLLGLHPSTFTHIVVNLFMIPIAYGVAYLLGRLLCKKNVRLTGMFLCAYCLFNLTNHVLPLEGIGLTINFMRWGKSILYCVLIPLLMVFMMEVMSQEKPGKMYLRLGFMLYGSCLASTMSLILLPALTGVWALWDALRVRSRKSIARLLIPCLLCIPMIGYALLYLNCTL